MSFNKLSILTVTLIVIVCMGVFAMGVYAFSVDQTPAEAQINTTGKPSLELNIRSATVEVVMIAENKVSAEYNKDVYDVVISDNNDVWKVYISCKTGTNTNQEVIKLYVPDFDYDKVSMNIKNAEFTCTSLKSGNIIGDFEMATVVLTLPEDFTGSLDATSTTAEFSLISQDDFKNTNVTLVDDSGWGDDEIYVPQNFRKYGNVYTYMNGTESNIIKVTKKNAGMIGFHLASEFNTIYFPYDVHVDLADVIDSIDVVSDTIKRPSLELVLEDAVVDMVTATDGKISAEYNKDVYDIQINQSEELWKVTCKRKTDTNNETVKLYIPAVNYGKINMSFNSVNLTCAVIKSGDIVGNLELSSVFLTLPKGFKGSLDLVTNGYLNLTSQDDFENTNSTIIAEDGMWRTIYAPKYFKRSGNMFTYTNGTIDNVIKITKKEDGVVGVYSSKNFGSADFSFNQQIDGENIDELKWENGSWEANWINNWLSNWNSEIGNEYID